MTAVVRQLVYCWGVTFLACLFMIATLLWWSGEFFIIPRYRAIAGLLPCLLITAAVFNYFSDWVNEGLNGLLLFLYISFFLGFALILISGLYRWRHPMHQYAVVHHSDSDDLPPLRIWLRDAPVVRMLELEGPRKSARGGWFGIERYTYSARTALSKGVYLADGNGRPSLKYETSGLAAWLFGIRAACEEFTFFSLNLTPFYLAYLYYRHRTGNPLHEPFDVQPIHALFLLTPFCIGLAPILEP